MLRNEIDAAVAESVLLHDVAAESFAPGVHAAGGPAESQPVPGRDQAIAEVVVVSVSERFIEQAHPPQRVSSIRGITRTHLISVAAFDGGVSLLEVEAHRARAERRARIAHVVTLRCRHCRIVELGDEPLHPARLHHDVLVDLADD